MKLIERLLPWARATVLIGVFLVGDNFLRGILFTVLAASFWFEGVRAPDEMIAGRGGYFSNRTNAVLWTVMGFVYWIFYLLWMGQKQWS